MSDSVDAALRRALDADEGYERAHDRESLDRSVTCWEAVLAHPDFDSLPRSTRALVVGAAATARFSRYRVDGDAGDLDRAIALYRLVVESGHEDSGDLSNLANALRARYEAHGVRADAEVALALYEHAVSLTPEDDPLTAGLLSNLGNALMTAYEVDDRSEDLDRAIGAYEQALEGTSSSEQRADCAANLAAALRARHERSGELADLESAITLGRMALDASRDPVERPLRQNILGAANPAARLRMLLALIREGEVLAYASTPASDATAAGDDVNSGASGSPGEVGMSGMDLPPGPSWQPDLRRRRRDGERGLDTSEELRFTPHLDVTPPPPLRPGARFGVEVYLDQRPARPGEETEDFRLAPPPEVDQLEVDVWLRSTSHFIIEGSPLGHLTIRLADAECVPARFALRVADPVPDMGDPGLAASFAYNLRQSGLVQRTIALELPDGLLAPAPPADIPGGGARIDPTAKPPDMDIEIHRKDGRNDLFEVTVRTADRVEMCDWQLDQASEDYVKKIMAQFFARNASARARVAALEGAGIAFFQAAPCCFQEVYWDLVDRGTPPETIYVVSEERSVPWELMIPRRLIAAGRDQRKPLGVQCAVGRWHRGSNITPRQHIPLTDSLVLAPRYSGNRTLKHAEAEVKDVHSWFPGERVPATFDELDVFLKAHNASLIHFICHGKDDTIQTILLEDKDELSSLQVAATGLSNACQARRPLVFLNACEVGRPGRALVGVGGFPAALIEEEASAVIAPLWAVDDKDAHELATQFYAELVESPETPFAELLRRLRARAYCHDGDDTFAAYCFYGDPVAAMRPPVGASSPSRTG